MDAAAPRLIRALSKRVPHADVSYRTRMMEMAAKLDDVIAMGRGDPDFHTPAHICEAAKAAIDANEHHYTLPAGLPQLRQAIAGMLRRDNDLDYAADEVVVTAGAQEAVMLCMLALVDAGDEVMLPSPRFTSYDTAVEMCGGVCVSVPTVQANDFALDPLEIEKRITARTKIVVLITPANPTGAVTPPDMVRRIADIAIRHDLIVISDEIYARIIFEGSEHLSIGSLPGMKERTITLNGFSKSYAMTGWRIGYLAAPQPFVRRLVEPRHTLSINANTPAQWAALAALTGPQEPVDEMVRQYAERRAFFMRALDEMGFSYGHPGGGFYIYCNVESAGLPATEFCVKLLQEARVLVMPGALFGDADDRYIRFGLLQPLSRIEEAARRMAEALPRIRRG